MQLWRILRIILREYILQTGNISGVIVVAEPLSLFICKVPFLEQEGVTTCIGVRDRVFLILPKKCLPKKSHQS